MSEYDYDFDDTDDSPAYADEADAGKPDDTADFDAWWRKHAAEKPKRPPLTFMGETWELPKDVPLQFQLEATKQDRLPRAQKDPVRLAVILFGRELVDAWVSKGIGIEQFSILIGWATANVQGKPMSFDEVAKRMFEAEEKAGESGEA